MKLEKTSTGRLVLSNSNGEIEHILPSEVYVHLHQRDDSAILLSNSADNQEEDNSIVLKAGETTDSNGASFGANRADLMLGVATLLGYDPAPSGGGGVDGGGGGGAVVPDA